MESTLLCIRIVLFHLSEHFTYLNTPWFQHVWISDFLLYIHLHHYGIMHTVILYAEMLSLHNSNQYLLALYTVHHFKTHLLQNAGMGCIPRIFIIFSSSPPSSPSPSLKRSSSSCVWKYNKSKNCYNNNILTK